MRRLLLALTVICLVMVAATTASAGVYTFIPSPSADMWDLDHYKAYKWGINWTTPPSQQVTNVVLTFKGIYDWTYEPDVLYTTLIDDPAAGVSVYTDNQEVGNYFGGEGASVGSWTDPYGDYAHRINLSYDFASLGLLPTFQSYAADGSFGFGFDPDCHYFNSGLELKVYTSDVPTPTDPVPEPATLTMLGMGMAGLGYYRRRHGKK